MRKCAICLSIVMFIGLFIPTVATAGEAFIKGGYIAYVGQDDDLNLDLNSLIFSGGTDWKISDYFSLGPEIQYSWKSVEVPLQEDKQKFHFFNLYGNVKVHIGDEGIRPFFGAGIGLVSATVLLEDLSGTEKKSVFGAQFMGGIVAGKKGGPAFVAEIQFKVPTGDLNNIKSANIMAGVVF
ncbi:hypothetical protein ACFLU6_11920 [Acidobacteriota bacterium]